LRTLNGRDGWEAAWDGPGSLRFWSISGIDANRALVTGTAGKWSQGTNVTYIFRTNDGGASWTQVFERHLGFLDDVTMFNEWEGCAIGAEMDGVFLFVKTTDGGNTWEYSPSAPPAMGGEYPPTAAINWSDKSTCWFGTSESRIFHTSDGGQSWEITRFLCWKAFYRLQSTKMVLV
jgi:photosystem II stability/assembly factor-like uncharacterized protein